MQSYRVQAQKGYLQIFHQDAPVEERDSFSCFHCGRVTWVKPKCDPADLGGFCRTCAKLICPECNAKGDCMPWEKQMEIMEARDRLYKAAQCY